MQGGGDCWTEGLQRYARLENTDENAPNALRNRGSYRERYVNLYCETMDGHVSAYVAGTEHHVKIRWNEVTSM
jgi:hypothetical protein